MWRYTLNHADLEKWGFLFHNKWKIGFTAGWLETVERNNTKSMYPDRYCNTELEASINRAVITTTEKEHSSSHQVKMGPAPKCAYVRADTFVLSMKN